MTPVTPAGLPTRAGGGFRLLAASRIDVSDCVGGLSPQALLRNIRRHGTEVGPRVRGLLGRRRPAVPAEPGT